MAIQGRLFNSLLFVVSSLSECAVGSEISVACVVSLGGPEISVVSCLWVDGSKCSVVSLSGPE